jgi:signal transduction histidine kinase
MDEPAVLIVDDEAAHLRALRRALASLSGCGEVRTADSGERALDAFAAGGVALVVSDQRMAGMSGIELLGKVRARSPEAVLVLLTAYADLSLLQRAVNEIGIYHYLEKPWSLAELRQVVARGLERFELERQRRVLLEDLRRSHASLRREVEYKNRLLSLLAHELGTPVHIAVNAVGLLLELPLDAVARRWVETLRRAADWLARGVGQMQRASVVASGRLQLRREPVDLAALAAAVHRELLLATGGAGGREGRRLDIVADCDGEVAVRGDARWLRHLVWSLLTNAVRFTPDGGRVAVATARRGGRAVLTIEDSGVGFAAAALEDAFVAFAGASGDPVLHGSGWLAFGARGLGLGLALSKRIVDAHGGRIEIDSSPRRGTAVRVELPLA